MVATVVGTVYLLSRADGAVIGQYSLPESEPVFSSPAPFATSMLVCCTMAGTVVCLQGTADGLSEVWRVTFPGERIYATPSPVAVETDWPAAVVGHALVIARVEGTVTVLSGGRGEVLCEASLPGDLFSSPVAVGTSGVHAVVGGSRSDALWLAHVGWAGEGQDPPKA